MSVHIGQFTRIYRALTTLSWHLSNIERLPHSCHERAALRPHSGEKVRFIARAKAVDAVVAAGQHLPYPAYSV